MYGQAEPVPKVLAFGPIMLEDSLIEVAAFKGKHLVKPYLLIRGIRQLCLRFGGSIWVIEGMGN